MVPEEELIAYAKERLKIQGFRKKNKRWTKTEGDFTLVFFIQGSQWSREDYYVRPGVFINGIETTVHDYYGHFHTKIASETPEQVLRDAEKFFREWTDKPLIRERVFGLYRVGQAQPAGKAPGGTGGL